MKIVAFGHRRRVGKNTAADFLYSILRTMNHNLRLFKGGYADAVKEQSFMMFRWAGLHPGVYYDNNPIEKEIPLPALGKSPRDIWIHVGEKMRELSPRMWVELLMENVPANTDIVVIYDLRKLPEAKHVQHHGGILCRVDRDVPQYSDPVDSELADFEEWDHIFDNNGTRKELMEKMHAFAKVLVNG